MTFGSNRVCYSKSYKVIGGKGGRGLYPLSNLMYMYVTKIRKDS